MPTTRPQPARILVVESTSTAALPILRTLRGAGHATRHVTNGATALQRLAAEPFDLVLAEWTRPEADALELVRRLQERPPAPPVVILTAIDDALSRELVLDAGASAFVTRPWQPADLLATVHGCLERVREPADEPLPPLALPALAPFHCVCIAARTGGPDAVRTLLRALPATPAAAFVLVVYGPAWMLASFAAAREKSRRCRCSSRRRGCRSSRATSTWHPATGTRSSTPTTGCSCSTTRRSTTCGRRPTRCSSRRPRRSAAAASRRY